MTAPVRTGFVAYSEVNNRTFKNNLPNNDHTRFSTLTLTAFNSTGEGTSEHFHFVQILKKRDSAIIIRPLTAETLTDEKMRTILLETNSLAFIHARGGVRELFCQNSMLPKFKDIEYLRVEQSGNADYYSAIRKDHSVGNQNDPSGIVVKSKSTDYIFNLFHGSVKEAIRYQ